MTKKQERGAKPPISEEQQRYMAFDGLIQWTSAVIDQAARVEKATAALGSTIQDSAVTRQLTILRSQTEMHFFAITANKVFEFRDWARSFGLFDNVDFSVLDQFSRRQIRDLRNMREHVTDYFEGKGNAQHRWQIETPEYQSDASARVGTMIGGRLDYARFAESARTLLPELLKIAPPQVNSPAVPNNN
jgi:hypothetical protein